MLSASDRRLLRSLCAGRQRFCRVASRPAVARIPPAEIYSAPVDGHRFPAGGGTHGAGLEPLQLQAALTREKILARLGPQLTADLYVNSSWRDRPPTEIRRSMEEELPAAGRTKMRKTTRRRANRPLKRRSSVPRSRPGRTTPSGRDRTTGSFPASTRLPESRCSQTICTSTTRCRTCGLRRI